MAPSSYLVSFDTFGVYMHIFILRLQGRPLLLLNARPLLVSLASTMTPPRTLRNLRRPNLTSSLVILPSPLKAHVSLDGRENVSRRTSYVADRDVTCD